MMSLTRDMIQAAQDFTIEQVNVDEWGGTLFMRSITVGALDDIQIRYITLTKGALIHQNGETDSVLAQNPELLRDMKPRLLSYSICDETGQLLFDDEEGRAILRQRDPAVIDRLYAIAERLSGMGADSVEAEKKASVPMPTPGSN